MKKRILAMIMTLAMCLSLLPTAAFATGTPTLTPPANSNDDVTVTKTAEPIENTGDQWKVTMTIDPNSDIDPQPLELVLVLDVSGSMNYCEQTNTSYHHQHSSGNLCPTTRASWEASRLYKATTEASRMLTTLETANVDASITIITFSGNSRVRIADSNDYNAARTVLTNLGSTPSSGGTNMYAGLNSAYSELSKTANPVKAVVMLADGDYDEYSPFNIAEDIREISNTTLYTIAFAADQMAAGTLELIASPDQNYTADSSAALANVFNSIASKIVPMVNDNMTSDTVSDVKITSTPTVNGTSASNIVANNGEELRWNAEDTIDSEETVTIVYDVTLKDIQSLDIGENIVDLNGTAKLSYSVGNNNKELDFPRPQAVVEVGQLVENYYLDGDLQENLTVTHPKVLVYDDNAFAWAADDNKMPSNANYVNSKVGNVVVAESGSVPATGVQYVVNHYYATETFTVKYEWTGDVPSGETVPVDTTEYSSVEAATAAKDITQYPPNKTVTGTDGYIYTFSGWNNITLDESKNVVIFSGSWSKAEDQKQTKDLTYTVEYYKDDVLVKNDTEVVTESVWINAGNTLTVDKTLVSNTEKYPGYTLEKTYPTDIPDTVQTGSVIKVYYATDIWNDDKNTTDEGDDTPDKYQALVTYKVEGGTWDGADAKDKIEIFTLKEKNAETDEWTAITPAPVLGDTIPDVSKAKPDATHTTPAYWSPTPYATDKVVNGAVYVYTFTKKSDPLTFTFDANGGSWAEAVEGYTMSEDNTSASINMNAGDNADKIAVEPTREGYEFLGWYHKNASGELTAKWWVKDNMTYPIYDDDTVYAKWEKIPVEEPSDDSKSGNLYVNLQDENGTYLGGTDTAIEVTSDYKVAFADGDDVDYTAPEVITTAGGDRYIFEYAVDYSAPLTGSVTKNDQNFVVVLQYTKDNWNDEEDKTTGGDDTPDKYQALVTYKVENGTWDGADAKDKIEIFTLKEKNAETDEWTAITPVPVLGDTIPDVSKAKPDATYTTPAYWSPTPYAADKVVNGAVYVYTFTEKGESLTFTFDANGGSWAEAVEGYAMSEDNTTASESYYFGNEVAKIGAEPVREGYTFVGWYTTEALTAELWTKYTPKVNIYEDTTVYAKWTENEQEPVPPAALIGNLYVNLQDENGTYLGGTDTAIEVTSDYKVAFADGDDVDYTAPEVITTAGGDRYIFEYAVDYSAPLTGSVTKNDQNFVVVLQYTKDNWNDNNEKDEITGGDNIPDKYQKLVTYKVVNGNWNDNTEEDVVAVVTLRDEQGNPSAEGSYTLIDSDVPGVGEKPDTGYKAGSWDTDPVGQKATEKDLFTYTYAKIPSGGGGGTIIPDNPPALNKVDHFAYIVGYPDGNVEPQGNITRAEVATIFFRMLTDESRAEFWSQSNDYSDVTATKWFNNAVSTLSNGGIITGYNNGTFKPNGNITRAEFATMAVRFFSASYEGEDLFPDIDKHWAKAYINTAAYEGIINGYEDGTFRPDQYITRAEAMTIVNRVLDRHPDKDNLLEDMIQWPDNMDTEKWYYADVQEATNSHDYDMEGTEAEPYEVWTEILPVRDWVALEKEWSDSNSAPGGEVMN